MYAVSMQEYFWGFSGLVVGALITFLVENVRHNYALKQEKHSQFNQKFLSTLEEMLSRIVDFEKGMNRYEIGGRTRNLFQELANLYYEADSYFHKRKFYFPDSLRKKFQEFLDISRKKFCTQKTVDDMISSEDSENTVDLRNEIKEFRLKIPILIEELNSEIKNLVKVEWF